MFAKINFLTTTFHKLRILEIEVILYFKIFYNVVHWTLDITPYLGVGIQPTLYPNERSNEIHYEVPFVVIIQEKK